MALAAFARRALARYEHAVAHYPLSLSCSLGFVIASAGDVACQHLEGNSVLDPDLRGHAGSVYDARRTLEMGVVRAFAMAPLLYVYFPRLYRAVPGTTWPRVFARVLVDQIVGAPVSIVLIFMASSAVKGRISDAPTRIREQMLPTWYEGIQFWPFIHIINFRFFAPTTQSLIAHVASLYWNIVLSRNANAKLISIEKAPIDSTTTLVVVPTGR